ncbi:MAG: DUF2914 domain-containing protein [Polyangiaceae bacterium]|nr:DUF2914 domain-containing protein [Polyangiaceae bacterium]MCW5791485.1 DUF2914 domain-containing protein [Polyangiaceae bacterium]
MSKSVKNLVVLAAVGVFFVGCDRGTRAEAEPASTSERAEASGGEAQSADRAEPEKSGLLKPLAVPNAPGKSAGEQATANAAAPNAAAPKDPASKDLAPKGAAADDALQGAPAGEAGALKVKRLVVTTAIEEREPRPVTEFKAGTDLVYAFVELANEGDEQGIVITFERVGKQVGYVELGVPAKQTRWRTWGRTRNIKQAGDWEAVVRTKGGDELARTRFQVS